MKYSPGDGLLFKVDDQLFLRNHLVENRDMDLIIAANMVVDERLQEGHITLQTIHRLFYFFPPH